MRTITPRKQQYHRARSLCATLLVLALALGALPAGAQEEQPTPTPETAPAPESEAGQAGEAGAPAPPPASLTLGQPTQRFTFDAAGEWLVGAFDFIDATQVDGQYQLTSTGIAGIVYSGMLDLDNFYAQVEVSPQTCPGNGAFGVAFRLSTNPVSDYYYYYVRCDATYFAGVLSDGAANDRVTGALAEPLRIASEDAEAAPERHVMGVEARGAEINLYWDGQRIGGFSDTLRTSGEFGLSVSPSSDDENVTLLFDNLTVWELPAEGSAPAAEPTEPAAEAEAEAGTVPGEKLYSFTFTEANDWFVGEDAFVRAELTDERYVITPLSGTAALFSNMVDVDDFYAEVEIEPLSCPPNAIIGFGFRQQQPGSYYVFGIRCQDGAWLVQKLPADVAPFASGQLDAPPAESGAPHVIGVRAEGQQFTLFWDDEEIGAFEDASFAHGDIGFHLQGDPTSDDLTVAFDNLEVWELVEGAPSDGAAPVTGGAAPAVGAPTQAAAVQVPIAVGSLRYETEFEEALNWVTGTTSYVAAEIVDGRYVLTSTDIVGTFWSAMLNLTDFYAQYEVTPLECPAAAAFGLPFRVNRDTANDFYVAIMQCDGNWRLSKVFSEVIPAEPVEVEEGTPTPAPTIQVQGEALVSGALDAPLTAGQSYTIGIEARGSELVFYWDGVELGRAIDTTHTAGDIGFQVRPAFPTYTP
ncbi:MAG: hypothetical protein M5R40_05610 [Anaerolineae bacterium]|nr:hypothetical protein [Anaerolineae bacterium]